MFTVVKRVSAYGNSMASLLVSRITFRKTVHVSHIMFCSRQKLFVLVVINFDTQLLSHLATAAAVEGIEAVVSKIQTLHHSSVSAGLELISLESCSWGCERECNSLVADESCRSCVIPEAESLAFAFSLRSCLALLLRRFLP